jgi:5-methylcytosine-specific restriction endonuclease McrA
MQVTAEVADFQCLIAESLADESVSAALNTAGLSHSDVAQLLMRFLSFRDVQQSALRYDLAIRVALHLSPPAAVHYDPLSPASRWKLVAEYIRDHLKIRSLLVDRLSRRVADILDRLQVERDDFLCTYRNRLVAKFGNKCALCGFKFDSPRAGRADDVLKPYNESWDELTRAEVDHINPISGTGDNDFRNLQLLCRLCNWGKGFGLVPAALEELRLSAIPLPDIPRAHRARLLYHTLARSAECALCKTGRSDVELTIDLIVKSGCCVLSNLQTVCNSCKWLSGNTA